MFVSEDISYTTEHEEAINQLLNDPNTLPNYRDFEIIINEDEFRKKMVNLNNLAINFENLAPAYNKIHREKKENPALFTVLMSLMTQMKSLIRELTFDSNSDTFQSILLFSQKAIENYDLLISRRMPETHHTVYETSQFVFNTIKTLYFKYKKAKK